MKFASTFKPWEACSGDKSRPVLTHVNLTIEQDASYLDATDSYCLVRVPCEVDATDVPGLILVDALKHAAKHAVKHMPAELSCLEGRCETSDGYAWPRPEGNPPDASSILKGTPAAGRDLTCGDFGINGTLLNRITRAMGARGVRVRCAHPLRPILVEPLGIDDGRVGIVMPIRLP